MKAKSTQVSEEAMLQALRRLVVDPEAKRLFRPGAGAGSLAANSPATRRLVDELLARGFIAAIAGENGPARYDITEQGRAWLFHKEDPRLLLEDLLRATESQCETMRSLAGIWREQQQRWEQQAQDIARALGRLPTAAATLPLTGVVEEVLSAHQSAGRFADCSMDELFRQARQRQPGLTIGQFHDCLRAMSEAGSLRLAPWTGPLYQLPQPELALLIGHEVLYYVHLARTCAA